jgi:hypothetical protein
MCHFFFIEKMSEEMVMCGKLSVIMKCGFRMHYEDFINQTMHKVLTFKI